MRHAEPTRRAVLAAGLTGLAGLAAAGGLAGCTDENPSPARPRPTTDAGADVDAVAKADRAMKGHVVADKRALLLLYAATAQAHPPLAEPLTAFTADHRAHLQALGAAVTTPSPKSPSPRSPSPESPSPAVAADPAAALAALARQEKTGSDQRLVQVGGVSPELARLLGSIGACEAAHAVLLPELAAARRSQGGQS